MSDFEELGGEPALRAIVDDFVDRVFADPMIGFFFQRADKARIKRFEYQHAARTLGADVPYEGRPLRSAHAPHRIMGGQFNRRLQILRHVLEAHSVPEPIRRTWLEHQASLRPEITRDASGECRGS